MFFLVSHHSPHGYVPFCAPHRDLAHEFLHESGAPREQGLWIVLAASLAPECRHVVKPMAINGNAGAVTTEGAFVGGRALH